MTELTAEQALELAQALQAVLKRRRYRRRVMGQVVLVPGQLGEALRLPAVIQLLQSRIQARREAGQARFEAIWDSLSDATRQATLETLGWYDPNSLPWDDPRSNRQPPVKL